MSWCFNRCAMRMSGNTGQHQFPSAGQREVNVIPYINTALQILLLAHIPKYYTAVHFHVISFPSFPTNKEETRTEWGNKHLDVLSEAVSGRGEQTSANVFGSQPFRLDGRMPVSDRPRASVQVEEPIGAGRWDLAWSQIIQVQLGLTHQQTAAPCRWPDTDVNVTCHWWTLTEFGSIQIRFCLHWKALQERREIMLSKSLWAWKKQPKSLGFQLEFKSRKYCSHCTFN